jgi:hypothetical protein
MDKEANWLSNKWGEMKRGAQALVNPGETWEGMKIQGNEMLDSARNKVLDTVTGTTKGQRKKMTDFVSNPEKAVSNLVKPYEQKFTQGMKSMENKAKGMMGVMGAGYLGTQLMNNMSANKRHQELMGALRNFGQQARTPRTPAAQPAWRLRQPGRA